MMKRGILFTVLFVFVIQIACPNLMADRRKYVWTYQFATIAPDAAELELYQTTKLAATDSWEYRVEIEHGLTPRWDMSVYQIFAQKESESFRWESFQIRTRYRLAEYGQFFVDPLLYIEYNRKIDAKKPNKLEARLVMAKDLGRFNASVNTVYEFFWAPGEPVHEPGLDIGLSYEFDFKYVVGIESILRMELDGGGVAETRFYLGPIFSFARGPIWYNIGYVWGLTDDSDNARVRFLMGIDL